MSYGALFSSKLVCDGQFEEAIAMATSEIAANPDEPEAYFNRAQARAALDRFDEAIADYEKALSLDDSASAVDREAADDELFFTLRRSAESQRSDPRRAVQTIERYREIRPDGRHLEDIAKWVDAFNGVETVWYRAR